MIILGIDPGTAIVGYAAIRKTSSGKTELIEADAIVPKSKEAASRLQEIHASLTSIIDIHRPDLIALEKIFFSKNIRTALGVSEARGVILLTAKEKAIRVVEYTPPEVKVAVTGYGGADKRQVKEMVKILFNQTSSPKLDDITDAMAIAFAALNQKLIKVEN